MSAGFGVAVAVAEAVAVAVDAEDVGSLSQAVNANTDDSKTIASTADKNR
jgi:hypothetical protein